MRWSVLIALLFNAAYAILPQCRNQNGQEVDWWIIFKEAGGKRYLYYDSELANANRRSKHVFQPMRTDRLLDDPATSPIIHTIYAGLDEPAAEVGAAHSDTVFIAVNDQPLKEKPNVVKDAYGAPVSEHNGHVKFLTAARVVYGERPAIDDATSYSYLLQHSLPRFPVVPQTGVTHEAIYGNQLPVNKSKVFSSNLDKKAQHFMCMSFEDRQPLDRAPETETGVYKHQLMYRPANIGQYLVSGQHHFVSILHYLKVVHAAVTATNYDPFRQGMCVFHQYLNSYSKWSERETDSQKTERNLNMARSSVQAGIDSPHLCPIWPLKRRVKVRANGTIEKLHTYVRDQFSMRSARDATVGVCLNGRLDNKLCLASAPMRTTKRHYEVQSLLVMKGRTVHLGLYDDLIAPMTVIPSDRLGEAVPAGELRAPELRMFVQTWIDNATLPANSKQIHPGIRLHVENVTETKYALAAGGHKTMASLGQDHSKWALLLPKETVGNFPGLFCIADLNRTYRQEHRGGGASCFTDSVFTELMIGMLPKVSDGFLDRGVPFDQLRHLYEPMNVPSVLSLHAYECKEANVMKCEAFFLGSNRADDFYRVSLHQSANKRGTTTIYETVPWDRVGGDVDLLIEGPAVVENHKLLFPII